MRRDLRPWRPRVGAAVLLGALSPARVGCEARVAVIDPRRVQRALLLTVERHLNGGWTVFGGAARHRLTVVDELGVRTLRCDCPAAAFGASPCKHAIALRLSRLGPDILAALRELVDVTAAA